MSDAVVTVLARRQTMVIGPTPPGTGVIAPATCDAAGKSTSPSRRVLPGPRSGASIRFMPTSITVAPGLIQSPLTSCGRPTAATTISACRTTSARLRVREWAIVTVQFSRSSNCAMGLPTRLERPTITALRPASEPSVSRSSIRQPSGVHDTGPGRPIVSLPTLAGVKQSTSLSGEMVAMILFGSM